MLRALTALSVMAVALAPVTGPLAETGRRSAVLVPLSAVGSAASSDALDAISVELARRLEATGKIRLRTRAQVSRALVKASRPDLHNCDGSIECLAELGRIAEADYAIFGEVGGLGDAQVVYLKLVVTTDGKVLRSTTLEFQGERADPMALEAAAIRLIAPEAYTGDLVVVVDVAGASIFVDGDKVAESPTGPVPLPVGSHALRVTHPEFRDFVRFVDIEFRKQERVEAGLQQFPVISSQIRKNATRSAGIVPAASAAQPPRPWHREWYTFAGIGAASFIASAVVFSLLSGGVDADQRRTIDVPQ